MKVLVINAGSSSLKYQLMDPATKEVLAKGLCERIGIDGRLTHKVPATGSEYTFDIAMPTHAEAIQAVLSRTDHKLPPPVSAFQGIVGREPYPVAEKASELLQRLLHLGVARFRALFRGSRSRSEVVATFLAVLELCKDRRLRLAGTAEDCTVTCTGPGEETESGTTERTED